MKQAKHILSLALALVLTMGMLLTPVMAASGDQNEPYDGGHNYNHADGNSIILHKLDIGQFERKKAQQLIADGELGSGGTVSYHGKSPTGESLLTSDVVGSYTTSANPTPVNVTLGELAALGNVVFRIEQVQLATGKTPGSKVPEDYELVPSGIDSYAKTDSTGQISWQGLPNGYYKITEQENDTGKPVGAADFIVSVPMVDPADDSNTIKTVHVYPKNRATEGPKIEKEKPDLSDFNGNTLTWTIQSEIPASLKPTQGEQSYVVTDTMQNGLTYAGNLQVYYKSGGNDVELAGGDYALTAQLGGTSLKIALTNSGFSTLGTALAGGSIETGTSGKPVLYIKYDTVVNLSQQELEANLNPQNEVELEFTNSDKTNYKDDPDPVVVGEYAGLKLIKQDGANKTLLPGAKFKVYTKLAGSALKGSDGIELEFTTDAQGQFTYSGLGAGDYYLVETAAPQGYKKLNKYTTITITQADVQGRVVKEATVLNYLDNGISLPETGGMGTALFTACGILLIALAVVLFVVSQLRTRKAEGK